MQWSDLLRDLVIGVKSASSSTPTGTLISSASLLRDSGGVCVGNTLCDVGNPLQTTERLETPIVVVGVLGSSKPRLSSLTHLCRKFGCY